MKPKHVYIVINPNPERIQINGCFYSKEAAEHYADGCYLVQKISVSTWEPKTAKLSVSTEKTPK